MFSKLFRVRVHIFHFKEFSFVIIMGVVDAQVEVSLFLGFLATVKLSKSIDKDYLGTMIYLPFSR